jgi:hypothetical protein
VLVRVLVLVRIRVLVRVLVWVLVRVLLLPVRMRMLLLVRCVAPGPVPRMHLPVHLPVHLPMHLPVDMAVVRLALVMVLALTMTVTMVLVRSVPRLGTCSRLLTVPPRVRVTLVCRHFEQAHDISALHQRWGHCLDRRRQEQRTVAGR